MSKRALKRILSFVMTAVMVIGIIQIGGIRKEALADDGDLIVILMEEMLPEIELTIEGRLGANEVYKGVTFTTDWQPNNTDISDRKSIYPDFYRGFMPGKFKLPGGAMLKYLRFEINQNVDVTISSSHAGNSDIVISEANSWYEIATADYAALGWPDFWGWTKSPYA